MKSVSRLRQFSGKGDYAVLGVIYAFLIVLLLAILFPLLKLGRTCAGYGGYHLGNGVAGCVERVQHDNRTHIHAKLHT